MYKYSYIGLVCDMINLTEAKLDVLFSIQYGFQIDILPYGTSSWSGKKNFHYINDSKNYRIIYNHIPHFELINFIDSDLYMIMRVPMILLSALN